MGSYFGGVNYFTPKQDSFVHYDYDQNATKNQYYSYIGDIVVDKNEHVWLSTDGGGISCTDKNWNIIHQFTAGGKNSIPHNNIKSICYDEENECIYIGTYLGGLSRYDLQTGQFYNYLERRKGEPNTPNEVVFHVKMWKGKLYLSARNGVFSLDTKTQKFHKLDIPIAYYEDFDIDPEGYLYLSGMFNLVCMHLDKLEASYIPLTQKGYNAKITRILATNNGAYISTLGGGLFFYDKKTHKTAHYTAEEHQLPSNFCYNVCLSPSGNILITSDKGVTSYSPEKTALPPLI